MPPLSHFVGKSFSISSSVMVFCLSIRLGPGLWRFSLPVGRPRFFGLNCVFLTLALGVNFSRALIAVESRETCSTTEFASVF